MSQVFNGATGAGLTTVTTDATLTGDGTVLSPLSVVPNSLSVAKTVFSNGTLPPIVSPALVFPPTDTYFTQTIASADVDFTAGYIRFYTTGTYRISMQLSFDKMPDPSQHDVQINFGLCALPLTPPFPLLYENITYHNFESNSTGQFSAEFSTVVEVTANQTLQPQYELAGTVGSTLSYYIGAEAGYIIVERLA
jgi:hypothetical protein